jgi:hypothetical protein
VSATRLQTILRSVPYVFAAASAVLLTFLIAGRLGNGSDWRHVLGARLPPYALAFLVPRLHPDWAAGPSQTWVHVILANCAAWMLGLGGSLLWLSYRRNGFLDSADFMIATLLPAFMGAVSVFFAWTLWTFERSLRDRSTRKSSSL